METRPYNVDLSHCRNLRKVKYFTMKPTNICFIFWCYKLCREINVCVSEAPLDAPTEIIITYMGVMQ